MTTTKVALNKASLKKQRDQLKIFQRFLPSLDLKRQQLMIEQKKARRAWKELEGKLEEQAKARERWIHMIGSADFHLEGFVSVDAVETDEENVVGVRLPVLVNTSFSVRDYSSLGSPAWVDQLVDSLREVAELRIESDVRRRRLELLDEAVRKITQRVNLFEKVLIPRAKETIDRIRIYLSDNERAAVCRSKLAKAKRQAASAEAMHPNTLPPLDPDPDGTPESHHLEGDPKASAGGEGDAA